MKPIRTFYILFLFSLASAELESQSDSARTVPLLCIHFGGQLPGGDLVNRFGPNLEAGGSFLIKTKRNFIYGLESVYHFGDEVKEDVMKQLRTPDGFVIDNQGFPADLRLTQRAFSAHLVVGKLFRILSPNKNSGIVFTIGVGYFQHEIHFYDAQQRVAAINGDLAYGYDRLSNGLSVSQFLGYMYLGENRLSNFFFGFDCYQAFTKSVRKVNYDTGQRDETQRLDILTGFRIGWILPLYRKTPNEFYYY